MIKIGALFSKPKTPEVKVQAPALDNPVVEPQDPELGAQETEEQKARKGKKGLKVSLDKAKGVGTNVT